MLSLKQTDDPVNLLTIQSCVEKKITACLSVQVGRSMQYHTFVIACMFHTVTCLQIITDIYFCQFVALEFLVSSLFFYYNQEFLVSYPLPTTRTSLHKFIKHCLMTCHGFQGISGIICRVRVQYMRRLALDAGEHFKGFNQLRYGSAYSVQQQHNAIFLLYGVNAVILSYLSEFIEIFPPHCKICLCLVI